MKKSIAIAAVLIGCSGATVVPPSEVAEDRLEAVALAHAEDTVFKARYNPAHCDVPPFEVNLDGVWYRVFVEPDDPDEGPAVLAREQLKRSASLGDNTAVLLLSGELYTGLREASTRAQYMVLEIFEICPASGCVGIEQDPEPEGGDEQGR